MRFIYWGAISCVTSKALAQAAGEQVLKYRSHQPEEIALDFDMIIAIGIGLLAVFIVLIVGSNLLTAPSWRHGGTARNLFLSINFSIDGSDEPAQRAYLRQLSFEHATFISTHRLTPGSKIQLELGGLPQFPEKTGRIEAKVTSSHRVNESHYVAHLQLAKDKRRESIAKYVQTLHSRQMAS